MVPKIPYVRSARLGIVSPASNYGSRHRSRWVETLETRQLLADIAASLTNLETEYGQFIAGGGAPANFTPSDPTLAVDVSQVRVSVEASTTKAIPPARQAMDAAGFVADKIQGKSTFITGRLPIANIHLITNEPKVKALDPDLHESGGDEDEVTEGFQEGDRLPDSLWDLYEAWQQGSSTITNIAGVWDAYTPASGLLAGYDIPSGVVFLKASFNTDDAAVITADVQSFGGVVGDIWGHGECFFDAPVSRIPDLVGGNTTLISAEPYDSLAYKRGVDLRSVHSQGDAAMGADEARQEYGVTGAGTKIGVISDSYNALNGAATDRTNGELPTIAANDIREIPNGAGGSDEGRAMMQIIHDVAPDAILAFASVYRVTIKPSTGLPEITFSASTFKSAIDFLVARGANVIVDDIGSAEVEPFFQDSQIDQAIAAARAQGVTYVTAAGNDGQKAYSLAFHRSRTKSFPRWNTHDSAPSGLEFGIPGTSGVDSAYRTDARLNSTTLNLSHLPNAFKSGMPHDFNPDAGTDKYQGFTLQSHQVIEFKIQWLSGHSAWRSVSGGTGVDGNIDAYILNSAATRLLSGSNTNRVDLLQQITDPNARAGDGYKSIRFENLSTTVQSFNLMLLRQGNVDRVKYVFETWTEYQGQLYGDGVYDRDHDLAIERPTSGVTGSMYGHTNSRDAISVVAAPWSDTAHLESF